MDTDQMFATYVAGLAEYAEDHPRPDTPGADYFMPWAEQRTKAALGKVVAAVLGERELIAA